MASDTKDKASNQKNYSEKNDNALNENNDMSSSGVDVPEEFQQAVHKLTSKATKAHLGHIRNKINDREDELRDQESAKRGDKGMMSTEGGPSNIGD